jgi:hypothetical protein
VSKSNNKEKMKYFISLAVLLLLTPSEAAQEPITLGERLSEYA